MHQHRIIVVVVVVALFMWLITHCKKPPPHALLEREVVVKANIYVNVWNINNGWKVIMTCDKK